MKNSSFTIHIFFKTPRTLKGQVLNGLCKFDGKNFKIYIDKNLSLINQIGTFFHELTHLAYSYFFRQELNEKKEEKYCKKIEGDVKKCFIQLISNGDKEKL